VHTLQKQGLLLGVYQEKDKDADFVLTPAAKQFAGTVGAKFTDMLELTKGAFKKGETRVFYGLDEKYPFTSVVHLGPRQPEGVELEDRDEVAENVRVAVSAGIRSLRTAGATTIEVDPCANAEAAAEGSSLALFTYEDLKKKESRKPAVSLSLFGGQDADRQRGLTKSEAQNFARWLMETPANHMTPTRFAAAAASLEKKGVKVIPRDLKWIEEQKMGSFLSVTRGSEEPPVFLELHYEGTSGEEQPLVLVGKGITFDSGGISLKPPANMDRMRGDMGGAACVVGAFSAIASLRIPIKMVGLIPLCENLPSGKATKPGDVVTAMNGTTIQVDNTDAEGRLVLADALCYSANFNPKAVVDLATLTGAMSVALGSGAAGAFCTSNALWDLLHQAGMTSGDRLWRMPLFEHYRKGMTKSTLADLNNISKQGPAGGACSAAAFLKEFVKAQHWAHLDIAGVMDNKDEVPYLGAGMSGRPVRTLVEFAEQLSKSQSL
ncbi:unnamed protein product, partial [Ixodes hexagonus]